MSDKKFTDVYDDGNIPDIDLPQNKLNNTSKDSEQSKNNVESLSELSNSKIDSIREN